MNYVRKIRHRNARESRQVLECGENGLVYPDQDERIKRANDQLEQAQTEALDVENEKQQIPTRLGKVLTGHSGTVTRAHFTHDGLHLMSCGQDRKILLWNPFSGLLIQQFHGPHNKEISDVAIFRSKSKFVSVGGDSSGFLWDVTNNRVIQKFSGHDSKIFSAALGHGDTVLFTGGDDRKVNVWDLRKKGRPIQTMLDARDSITAVHYRDNVHKLYTASVDGVFREYDIRNGAILETEFKGPITSFAFTKDYDAAAIGLLNGSVRLIDLMAKNSQINAYCVDNPGIYRHQVTFDPFDRNVMMGDGNGKLLKWKLDVMNPYDHTVQMDLGDKIPIFHVEFAPEKHITDLGVKVNQTMPWPAYITCSMGKNINVYFDEIEEDN